MSAEYRLAKSEDLDGIYAVEKRCFRTPWLFESLKQDLCSNNYSLYLAAEQEGKIVGFCGVHVILDECHINNIAVLEEHRRKGIARSLIDLLIKSTEHISKLYWLEVRQSNTAAKKLYESFGFVPVAVRPGYYSDTQEDAIVMLKSLKTNQDTAI